MAVIGEIHRDPSARPRSSVPLISLGQGDFRRDFFPEDFGMSTENHTPAPATTDSKLLEAEVLGAALRYVAVADWIGGRWTHSIASRPSCGRWAGGCCDGSGIGSLSSSVCWRRSPRHDARSGP